MKFETEEKVKAEVAAFVASLEGRFREHCSDAMLTAILMHRLRQSNRHNDKSLGTAMLGGDPNAAYEAACPIFEYVLEHGCRAGGNGHHVAQNFCAAMEAAVPRING